MLHNYGALNTFDHDCGLETKLGTLPSYSLFSNSNGPINIQSTTMSLCFSVDNIQLNQSQVYDFGIS
jgi:hypothetical protein